MAKRRMFTLDIVDTDQFMDMPVSSQNLYFHLGMRADDDGFCDSPRRIARNINASDDDFNVLLCKGYLIAFESGIVVITDWRQNNYVRNDRYTKTKYQKELQMLEVNNEGRYSLLDTTGIPNVYQMDTQVRLGKVSIGKYTISSSSSCNTDIQDAEDEELVLKVEEEDEEIKTVIEQDVEQVIEHDLSKIAKVYEQEIANLSPTVMDDFKEYLDAGIDVDLIIECIREASRRNSKNFKYIDSIVRNCQKKGIKSVVDFKNEQDRFKRTKGQGITPPENLKPKKDKYDNAFFNKKNKEDW